MADKGEDAPKIFVDSDWKAEAQKAKEELDRETRETPEAGDIPPPSILELVQMVIMQASIGLGGYQDPQTGRRLPPDLPVARHYIDLLQVLDEKTKGNLNEEEKSVIESTLHELRMVYVQIAGAMGGAPAPGPVSGAAGTGGAGQPKPS